MKKVSVVASGLLVVGALAIGACSKEDKGSGASKSLSSAPAPKVSSFQHTALAYVPDQSIAFFLWKENIQRTKSSPVHLGEEASRIG